MINRGQGIPRIARSNATNSAVKVGSRMVDNGATCNQEREMKFSLYIGIEQYNMVFMSSRWEEKPPLRKEGWSLEFYIDEVFLHIHSGRYYYYK